MFGLELRGCEGMPLAMEVEVKATGSGGSGKFEGYASTRKLDSDRDIVMPGAFKRTLDHIAGKGLPLLWFHDPREPVGMIYPEGEDQKGLFVSGECDVDVKEGHRVYSGMVKGYIDRMSIGYKAVRHDYDRKQQARRLHEVALKEISAITKGWAANDEALITALKSIPTYIDHCVSSWPGGSDSHTRVGINLAPETIEELIESLQKLLESDVLSVVNEAHVGADDDGAAAAASVTDDTPKDSTRSAGATGTKTTEDGSAIATLIRETTTSIKAATSDEVKAAAAVRRMIDGLKTDYMKG